MLPLSITMQAFGPFRDNHTINFSSFNSKGPVILYGQAGTGKTFVLKALKFALFGSIDFDDNDSNLYDLRNINADPKNLTMVLLDFKVNNNAYRIIREFKYQIPLPGELMQDNHGLVKTCLLQHHLDNHYLNKEYRTIESGWVHVTRAIEHLIGVSKNQYIDIISPDIEGSSFLLSEPGIRTEKLKQIFQAKYKRKIWNEIISKCNKYLRTIQQDNLILSNMGNYNNLYLVENNSILVIINKDGNKTIGIGELSAGELALLSISLHVALITTFNEYRKAARTELLIIDRALERLESAIADKIIKNSIDSVLTIYTSADKRIALSNVNLCDLGILYL